jgi:hypothetical protein
MALPFLVELHIDDELLERDPGRWPELRALLWQVGSLAQGRSARLGIRFRLCSARRLARDGIAQALVSQGHEIGAHAHGAGLAEVVEALRAAGLRPTVGVPGLVQAGAARAPLLKQARALGLSTVVDHGPERAWAYEGLLPRPEEGLLVLAPTVLPWDWGLMGREGRRHGLTRPAVARLLRLRAQAEAQGASYFCVALHEHDICAPGELEPSAEALDALADMLGPDVLPAEQLGPAPLAPAAQRLPAPLFDAGVRVARVIQTAVGKAGGLGARVGSAVTALRPGEGPPGTPRALMVGRRRLRVLRKGSDQAVAALVLSHSGREGGLRTGLAPFGLGLNDLIRRGWAVWLYDRSGAGLSPPGPHPGLAPGNPDHVEDWIAVLEEARAEGLPVVALSWSAGLIPILAAATRGHRPDALIDGEAPVDRWSLLPPAGGRPREGLAERDLWRPADWEGSEALGLIAQLDRPYARLQATRDHMHGEMTHHADRIEAAARAAGLPLWGPHRLQGSLHAHPSAVLEALEWALTGEQH